MTTVTTHLESFKVSDAHGVGLSTHVSTMGTRYITGAVVTRHGIVAVLSQDDHSRFDFVHDGRHYIRSDARSLTTRGLVRIANQFARSIVREAR